ncbi:MAG: Cys-Gln thioester bond-forming surface protein [Clostridia bacterium]|nr:Cys-Gln thioester bond-forming surface protein [Clostridia bacterium]
MAKLQRSITAMLLMLVMLLTLAFPALAAAGETIWQGNDVSLSFVRGEDPYVYAIAQDPANNRWYYETSNHTLKKEVTGGGAVHIFPIVDTTKVTGPWDPEGIYQSGISNYDVMYCCDAVTGTDGEIYYKRVNLEDSEYVTEADVKKLRAIISNAYPYVSVEEAKAALKEAGFAQADELDRSELIAATQAAIWTIANPDSGDSYRYNKTATTAQKLTWGGYMHEFAGEITNFTDSMTSRKYLSNPNGVGDRINALIDFYLAMKDVEAEDGQIVITSLNIVDSKLFGSDKEYKVDINVELNHGADEDDTVEINVYVGDTLAETVAVTDAKAYSFSVEAVENDDIRVVVSGTQNLERGVYFYVPKPADVDGDGIATSREVSQNLIGVASGETPVYATAAVTITDGNIINKTTIPLYEDKFADVTLEVNGKVEYKPDGGVDIVIALGSGMASYQNTYDSVISLVEPLIEKGINVKLGLIAVEHYDDVAMELTALTAESYKETIANGLAKIKEMPAGPTNLHGNILAAKAMLDADETVPAENKFFYVIATGRTYNFDNANGVPTTIINKVSVNGSTYYYWGHYLWQSQRGQHTSLYRVPTSYNNDFAAFWADVEKWVEADGDKYAYSFPNYDVTNDQWFNEYMNENSTDAGALGLASSRYGWVIKALTDSGVEAIGSGAVPQNALNYERAQYEAYYAYKSMVDAGYTCQALCSENVAYQNYSPYMTTQNATPGIQLGHSFMDHMAKLSGQEASTLLFNLLDDNGNYEMLTDFFQKIDISKLTLEKASAPFVEDYIGFGEDYDFDFTGLLEKLVLKLDGEAYFTSVLEAAEGATASYGFSKEEGGKLSFRVDYFKGNEPTEERFVWYFYETVAEDSVVTLTYQLELVKRNENIGTHIAETNQIAVLYPTGDRTYGQLFPVPEVTYSNYPDLEGEKKSEQIGSNRFEISIEVPGGGLDPKHDEIILMVDGSYSLDDEWPAMKEAIELIGKTVLNGNGNTQLTLMAFGMGDNVVLEHVKSVDDLVAALGVLPGTLLYGRSSTNCEVGFVGVAEYIKKHDNSWVRLTLSISATAT